PEPARALMRAGADRELIAMPGADDVGFGRIVLQRARRAVIGNRLDHAFHDPALAHWTGAMGAAVVPGEELVADPEDADLELPAIDDLAVAVGIVGNVAREIFAHASLPRGTIVLCLLLAHDPSGQAMLFGKPLHTPASSAGQAFSGSCARRLLSGAP